MNEKPPTALRLVTWVIVGVVALDVLAMALPRLLVPLVVLAIVAVVVRVVFFYTRL